MLLECGNRSEWDRSASEASCTVGSQRDSKHPIQYELHRFIDFLNLQYGDLKVALLQYGDSKVALLAALLCFGNGLRCDLSGDLVSKTRFSLIRDCHEFSSLVPRFILTGKPGNTSLLVGVF